MSSSSLASTAVIKLRLPLVVTFDSAPRAAWRTSDTSSSRRTKRAPSATGSPLASLAILFTAANRTLGSSSQRRSGNSLRSATRIARLQARAGRLQTVRKAMASLKRKPLHIRIDTFGNVTLPEVMTVMASFWMYPWPSPLVVMTAGIGMLESRRLEPTWLEQKLLRTYDTYDTYDTIVQHFIAYKNIQVPQAQARKPAPAKSREGEAARRRGLRSRVNLCSCFEQNEVEVPHTRARDSWHLLGGEESRTSTSFCARQVQRFPRDVNISLGCKMINFHH